MKKLGVIGVILVIAGIIGEIKCIVKFIDSDFKPSYKREAVYGLSAICGVGAVVGWMDFPDEPAK
jgi:hypothetical protein